MAQVWFPGGCGPLHTFLSAQNLAWLVMAHAIISSWISFMSGLLQAGTVALMVGSSAYASLTTP